MKQDKTEIFERKPPAKAVAALAIPTVFSQIITLIYNLADTFFVGHTGDPNQVAALTLVFPIYMFLTGIGNLFGIGANSRISRCLGVGDREGAKEACRFSFWGGLLTTGVLLLLLGSFLTPILRAMGASDQTLVHTRGYVCWVMLVGRLPTEASLLLAHLLRGEGSAKEASFGMMLGGVLNMVLDPIFIFPLSMGVAGAGFATMLSNVVCLLYYLLVLVRSRGSTVVTLRPGAFAWRNAKEILLVGLPAAAVIALGSSANIILTRSLAGYSDLAVASFGVTQKFGTITMNIAIGLTQGIMPLIGYNYAAGNFTRVKAVCRCAFEILFAFIAVFLTVYQMIPGRLMGLFVSDGNTVELGAKFLRRWSLCIPGMTFVFLFNAIFQAMGRWKRSLLLSVLRQGVIFIPAMLILRQVLGMYGLIWAQPLADTLALGLGVAFYRLVVREFEQNLQENSDIVAEK